MTECCCRLTIWFSFSSPGRKLIFNNFLRVPLLGAPIDDIFARHTWQKWEDYRNLIWKANFLLARIFFYDFPVIRRAAENIKQFELIFLTPSHEWRERNFLRLFSSSERQLLNELPLKSHADRLSATSNHVLSW